MNVIMMCCFPLSQNIGKKMTCQEFITNLQGVNEGADFSKDLLKVSIGLLVFKGGACLYLLLIPYFKTGLGSLKYFAFGFIADVSIGHFFDVSDYKVSFNQ
jgi:lipoprotein signal peptidase